MVGGVVAVALGCSVGVLVAVGKSVAVGASVGVLVAVVELHATRDSKTSVNIVYDVFIVNSFQEYR